MEILEQTAATVRKLNRKLVCCVSFDEMSIKQHLQWCQKTNQFIGTVTYGSNAGDTASNAIVFLVNGLNAQIQLPVAYYFITNLDGNSRKDLLIQIVNEILKRDVDIANITFDGLPARRTT